MASTKTLQLLAKKLGLAEEGKVLSKAAEFERLLHIRSIHNLSDTSKVVICLDLAASLIGVNVDPKTAVKYSGLKGPGYKNSRKVVENLLELNNDKITISSLCLNLQCTGVQDLAENVLLEYQKLAKMELDMALPQYVCMAVYQACRVKNVKISKSKIIEKSQLKPGQWSKLEAEWTKFVDGMPLMVTTVKKRGRPLKVTTKDEKEMEINTSPIKEKSEPKIESYEDWKRRMLEQAYKELKMLETDKYSPKKKVTFHNDEILSPRKKVKTPQNSPYKQQCKSSGKPAGLRLVYPQL